MRNDTQSKRLQGMRKGVDASDSIHYERGRWCCPLYPLRIPRHSFKSAPGGSVSRGAEMRAERRSVRQLASSMAAGLPSSATDTATAPVHPLYPHPHTIMRCTLTHLHRLTHLTAFRPLFPVFSHHSSPQHHRNRFSTSSSTTVVPRSSPTSSSTMLAVVLERFITSRPGVVHLPHHRPPSLLSVDLSPTDVVVRVICAGVNPSDIKNVTGQMPHTTLPRTVGRDFSGVVCRTHPSASHILHRPVYGTGGELGYLRDGSHAEYLLLPLTALTPKPPSLTHAQAACVGVNFITAYTGLHLVGGLSPHDTVLVTGASGGVGTAVRQLAKLHGARVITVDRTPPKSPPPPTPTSADLALYLADLPPGLRRSPRHRRRPPPVHRPAGRRAHGGFVGGGRIQADGERADADLRLAGRGGGGASAANPGEQRPPRQHLHQAHEAVSLDLHDMYRRQLRLLGANSLYVDAVQSAKVLGEWGARFEAGEVTPAAIGEIVDVRRDGGKGVGAAYASVAKGARGKVVLAFDMQMAEQR